MKRLSFLLIVAINSTCTYACLSDQGLKPFIKGTCKPEREQMLDQSLFVLMAQPPERFFCLEALCTDRHRGGFKTPDKLKYHLYYTGAAATLNKKVTCPHCNKIIMFDRTSLAVAHAIVCKAEKNLRLLNDKTN